MVITSPKEVMGLQIGGILLATSLFTHLFTPVRIGFTIKPRCFGMKVAPAFWLFKEGDHRNSLMGLKRGTFLFLLYILSIFSLSRGNFLKLCHDNIERKERRHNFLNGVGCPEFSLSLRRGHLPLSKRSTHQKKEPLILPN